MSTSRTSKPVDVITLTGAIIVSNARFEYRGQQITATMLMSAATIAAKGSVISGIPRAVKHHQ